MPFIVTSVTYFCFVGIFGSEIVFVLYYPTLLSENIRRFSHINFSVNYVTIFFCQNSITNKNIIIKSTLLLSNAMVVKKCRGLSA